MLAVCRLAWCTRPAVSVSSSLRKAFADDVTPSSDLAGHIARVASIRVKTAWFYCPKLGCCSTPPRPTRTGGAWAGFPLGACAGFLRRLVSAIIALFCVLQWLRFGSHTHRVHDLTGPARPPPPLLSCRRQQCL